MSNQYSLWIPDSENDGEKQVIYRYKEKYCIYILKKAFFDDFQFCGFRLFLRSFITFIKTMNEEVDTGYIEKHFEK